MNSDSWFPVRTTGFALLALITAAVPAASAHSTTNQVTIGEVHAQTPEGEFSGELRQALREELKAVEGIRAREPFVLSANLVQLKSQRTPTKVKASVVVSLVLVRAKDSTLHALLSGRATAEEQGKQLQAARDSALHAAVSSALRGLPQAVR